MKSIYYYIPRRRLMLNEEQFNKILLELHPDELYHKITITLLASRKVGEKDDIATFTNDPEEETKRPNWNRS